MEYWAAPQPFRAPMKKNYTGWAKQIKGFGFSSVNKISTPFRCQHGNSLGILSISHHRHDRFHCDFSSSIIGNIYVVPGSFLFHSLPLWEANTPTQSHGPLRSLPPGPWLPSAKYLVLGADIKKAPWPNWEREDASDFRQVSDKQKGSTSFTPSSSPPPWVAASEDDISGWKAELSKLSKIASGILIEDRQHLHLFTERGEEKSRKERKSSS